jgi:hypothetical protein
LPTTAEGLSETYVFQKPFPPLPRHIKILLRGKLKARKWYVDERKKKKFKYKGVIFTEWGKPRRK